MSDKHKEMVEWKKENGNKVVTNDLPATVEYAESLGWTRIDE